MFDQSYSLPPEVKRLIARACRRAHKRGKMKGHREGHEAGRREVMAGLKAVAKLNGSASKLFRKSMIPSLPAGSKSKYREEDHPRDTNGEWIKKDELAQAAMKGGEDRQNLVDKVALPDKYKNVPGSHAQKKAMYVDQVLEQVRQGHYHAPGVVTADEKQTRAESAAKLAVNVKESAEKMKDVVRKDPSAASTKPQARQLLDRMFGDDAFELVALAQNTAKRSDTPRQIMDVDDAKDFLAGHVSDQVAAHLAKQKPKEAHKPTEPVSTPKVSAELTAENGYAKLRERLLSDPSKMVNYRHVAEQLKKDFGGDADALAAVAQQVYEKNKHHDGREIPPEKRASADDAAAYIAGHIARAATMVHNQKANAKKYASLPSSVKAAHANLVAAVNRLKSPESVASAVKSGKIRDYFRELSDSRKQLADMYSKNPELMANGPKMESSGEGDVAKAYLASLPASADPSKVTSDYLAAGGNAHDLLQSVYPEESLQGGRSRTSHYRTVDASKAATAVRDYLSGDKNLPPNSSGEFNKHPEAKGLSPEQQRAKLDALKQVQPSAEPVHPSERSMSADVPQEDIGDTLFHPSVFNVDDFKGYSPAATMAKPTEKASEPVAKPASPVDALEPYIEPWDRNPPPEVKPTASQAAPVTADSVAQAVRSLSQANRDKISDMSSVYDDGLSNQRQALGLLDRLTPEQHRMAFESHHGNDAARAELEKSLKESPPSDTPSPGSFSRSEQSFTDEYHPEGPELTAARAKLSELEQKESEYYKDKPHVLSGDTYENRDKLKALGAKWNAKDKQWTVTGDKVDQLPRYVNATRPRGDSPHTNDISATQKAITQAAWDHHQKWADRVRNGDVQWKYGNAEPTTNPAPTAAPSPPEPIIPIGPGHAVPAPPLQEPAKGAEEKPATAAAPKVTKVASVLDKPKGKVPGSTGDSLYSIVKAYGGIDPDSHALKAHFGSIKEAREYGLALGLFKKGGNGLDSLAEELHNAGHIIAPEGSDKTEHLVEQLVKKARSAHADRSDEYDKALDDHYRAIHEEQEAQKKEGTYADAAHRSKVEEAVRLGEETGRREGEERPYGGSHEGTGSTAQEAYDPDLDFNEGPRPTAKPKANDSVHYFPAFGNRNAFSAKFFPGRHADEVGVGYADNDRPQTYMPKESAKHFVNDLSGKVDVPANSGNHVIDSIASGKGEMLGKGDDGIVFGVGDKVAKVSTTVPFQPFNPGHRSPADAARTLESQVSINNKLAGMGIPGIMKQELVKHGDKAFAIRDRLEMPDKLTHEQLQKVRRSMDLIHKAGYVVGDDVQVGLKDGEPYLYDLGKAQKVRDENDYKDDSHRFGRFAEQMGGEHLPLRKHAETDLQSHLDSKDFWIKEDGATPKWAAQHESNLRRGIELSKQAERVAEKPIKATGTPTDLFGRELPKNYAGKKGPQLTLDDAARETWVRKIGEWADKKGVKVDGYNVDGTFTAGGKKYQMGGAESGYEVAEVEAAPNVSKPESRAEELKRRADEQYKGWKGEAEKPTALPVKKKADELSSNATVKPATGQEPVAGNGSGDAHNAAVVIKDRDGKKQKLVSWPYRSETAIETPNIGRTTPRLGTPERDKLENDARFHRTQYSAVQDQLSNHRRTKRPSNVTQAAKHDAKEQKLRADSDLHYQESQKYGGMARRASLEDAIDSPATHELNKIGARMQLAIHKNNGLATAESNALYKQGIEKTKEHMAKAGMSPGYINDNHIGLWGAISDIPDSKWAKAEDRIAGYKQGEEKERFKNRHLDALRKRYPLHQISNKDFDSAIEYAFYHGNDADRDRAMQPTYDIAKAQHEGEAKKQRQDKATAKARANANAYSRDVEQHRAKPLSVAYLRSEINREGRWAFGKMLKETGEYTDGKIVLKLPEKMKDKILSGVQVQDEGRYPDTSAFGQVPKGSSLVDLSHVGGRSIELENSAKSKRTTKDILKSYLFHSQDGKVHAEVNGKYIEMAKQAYPDATFKAIANGPGMAQRVNVYSQGQYVGIIMPLMNEDKPVLK